MSTQTKPTEKNSSEIAKTQNLDPAIYESVGDALDTSQPVGNRVPWVGFFGSKTKGAADSLKQAGIAVDDFYLYDNEPIKVKPFQFHLMKFRRFYTQVDNDGNITGVILTRPTEDQYKIEKYREYIMAQVIVVSRDPLGKVILTPATWGARSGLAKVFQKAISFMQPGGAAVNKDSWATRGTLHAISANAKFAGGRFVVTAWGSEESTLDGKNKYNLADSSVSPTPAEQVAAFNDLVSGANFANRIVPAHNAWEWRCKSLDKKASEKK